MTEKQKADDCKQLERSNYVRMDKHGKHFLGMVPKPPLDYHPQVKRVSSEPVIGEKRSTASLKMQVSVADAKYELDDSYCTPPPTDETAMYGNMEPISGTQATTSKSEDNYSTRPSSAEIPDYENLETFTDKRASVSKIGDNSISSASNSATGKELYRKTNPWSTHQTNQDKVGASNPLMKVAIKKHTLKASVPVQPRNSGSVSTTEYKNVKGNDGDGIYYNKTNDMNDN